MQVLWSFLWNPTEIQSVLKDTQCTDLWVDTTLSVCRSSRPVSEGKLRLGGAVYINFVLKSSLPRRLSPFSSSLLPCPNITSRPSRPSPTYTEPSGVFGTPRSGARAPDWHDHTKIYKPKNRWRRIRHLCKDRHVFTSQSQAVVSWLLM